MPVEFSPSSLLRMSELVSARMGLRFPPDRWPELALGIAETCAELGVADVEAWVDNVLGGLPTVAQLQALARRLTTGESYFFRQPEVFRYLSERILPELANARRRAGRLALRVWVAGCSTGEEAYSIAIAIRQTLPDFAAWDVVIQANDINPAAIRKASAAVYSEWSFRTTANEIRVRYFRPEEKKHWSVAPEIRRMVKFSYLNLADEAYPALFAVPGIFDLIFCRNVLMYFGADRQEPVLLRLKNALANDGRLVLGPCDGTLVVHELLEREPDYPTIFRRPEGRVCEVTPVPKISTSTTPLPSPEIGDIPTLQATSLPPVPEALETSAAITPEKNAGFAEAARAAADRGDHERALMLSEHAIATDKLNAANHFLRACILIELGRLADAEAALRSVLFLDPAFVIAHFALGTLARQQGQAEVSRRHFSRAEQLLEEYHGGETLPGSDGLTAARLQAILEEAEFSRR